MSLRVTLTLLYVLMGSNVMIQVDAAETLTLEQLTEIVQELKPMYENLGAQLQDVSQRVTASTTEMQEKKVQLRAQFMHRSKMSDTKTKNLESQIETFRTELGSVSRTTAALQAQNISIYTQLSNFIAEGTNRHKKTESQIVGLEQRVTSQMSQLQKSTDDSKERLRQSVEDVKIGLDRQHSRFSNVSTTIEEYENYRDVDRKPAGHCNRGDPCQSGKELMHFGRGVCGIPIQHRENLLNQHTYFLATLGSEIQNIPDGVVRFDKVISQTGYDYNPNTGIFTAPRNGLYAFVVQGLTTGGTSRQWALYLNGKVVLRSIYSSSRPTGSNLALPLKLMSKDEVSVRAEKIAKAFGETFSIFGGWMIKAL